MGREGSQSWFGGGGMRKLHGKRGRKKMKVAAGEGYVQGTGNSVNWRLKTRSLMVCRFWRHWDEAFGTVRWSQLVSQCSSRKRLRAVLGSFTEGNDEVFVFSI